MSENKREIFISYRRSDNANNYVEKLHKSLEEMLGKGVFFDQKDLWKWSKDGFPLDLRNAIDNCYCFLCIVSQDYLTLREGVDWCEEELKHAKERHVPVVAIVLDNATETGDFKRINPEGSNHCRTDGKEPSEHDKLISWLKSKTAEFSVGFDTSSESVDENSLRKIVELIFNTMFLDGQRTSFDEFLNKQTFAKEDVGESIREDIKDWITFNIKKQKTNEELQREKEESDRMGLPFAANLDYGESDMNGFLKGLENEKRAVITGDAGQGKSIYLKQLCNKLSEVLLERQYSRNELFPIYAELKRIDGCLTVDNDIIDAIARATQNGMTKEMLKCVIRNGMPCFLFDGIDEISPERFIAIKALLESCDDLTKENVRMVFTSRPGQQWIANNADATMKSIVEGNVGDVIVRRWKLDAISNDIFESFAKQVFNAIPKDEVQDSKATAEEFIGALKAKENEDKRYITISRNTFMLKMVSKYFAINKSLPNTKIEAFDHAVNDIVDRDIKREKAQGNDIESSFAENVKQVLGKIAFELYKAKDGNNARGKFVANDAGVKGVIEGQFKRNEKKIEKVDKFFDKHKLIDQNGFAHDLFACYYCAFYIYKKLDENQKFGLKEFAYAKDHMEKDYWRGVVEMLICLIEYNANGEWQEEYQELLDTMLTSMQTEVKDPDYDLLCEAVVQFIDEENRALAEKNLILGMLERGERGIKTFDTETYTCSDGANPYDELFYYVAWYDLLSGLKSIDESDLKGANKKGKISAIQAHLFNELCEIVHVGNGVYEDEELVDRYSIVFCEAASIDRFVDNLITEKGLDLNGENIVGHITIYAPEDVGLLYGNVTSISVYLEDNFNIINICHKLKYINADCERYIEKDNCLIEKASGTCVLVSNLFSGFPEEVKIVNQFAFNGCREISKLILAKNIEEIKMPLFILNNAIEEIVNDGNENFIVSNNCVIKDKTIIVGCKNSIIANDGSVTAIGQNAFGSCLSLEYIDIPSNIEIIREEAFGACSELKRITISTGVRIIEEGAFSRCKKLKTIDIDKNNTFFSTDGNCLIDIERKTLLWGNKDTVIPMSGEVEIIGGSAFAAVDDLEFIFLPKSIKRIEDGAFLNCFNLSSITIPENVTKIGNYAFSHCHQLKEITLPKSIERIGWHVFSHCLKLENVIVEEGVEYIPKYAFYATSLESIDLPDSVYFIGEQAFCHCEKLESFHVNDTSQLKMIEKDAFFGTAWLDNQKDDLVYVGKVAYEYRNNEDQQIDIKDGTLGIAAHMFEGHEEITDVQIPDSVIWIGESAFEDCGGLTKISFPKSVLRISERAFANCKRIERIDCCDGQIEIKKDAFIGCDKIKTIVARATNVVTISNQCEGIDVSVKVLGRYIGDNAFESVGNVVLIVVDDTIKTIGKQAFMNCANLEVIRIGNSVSIIGEDAFKGCDKLARVNVSSIQQYCSMKYANVFSFPLNGNYEIEREVSLRINDNEPGREIIIPEGTNMIPPFAFSKCQCIEKVYLSNSVVGIGSLAFLGCVNLKEFDFGEKPKLKVIGSNAFVCSGIERLVIPSNVERIGVQAFAGCNKLNYVVIPKAMKVIQKSVFAGCEVLISVFYGGTEEQWRDIDIGEDNECLLNAKRYYYSENKPIVVENIGESWHFAEDGKTPIVWGE